MNRSARRGGEILFSHTVMAFMTFMTFMTFLTGCEPCSGVAQCRSSPYLAIDGQIVEAATGTGVDGVRVDVIRRSGVAVNGDSLSTLTASGGHWRVAFQPASEGTLEADVVVTPSGVRPYRVSHIVAKTTASGGDATVLPRWVSDPYFHTVGEIFLHQTVDDRVGGAVVQFRRTGGVALGGTPLADGVFTTSTDPFGRFAILSPEASGIRATEVGDVVGDLTIMLPGGQGIHTITGAHFPATYLYRDPAQVFRFGAGPSLDYSIEFSNRVTHARVPGVQVQFERTGGVPVSAAQFTATSGPDGRFSILTRPLATGTLEGRIIFRAPAPSTPETLLVKLPTFDDDAGRFFQVFGAGAYLPYYGIVGANGAGVNGLKVDVHRTGGIAIAPADFTLETVDGGIFRVQPSPLSLGDVIVDLTIHPPSPAPAFTVRGVRLTTADRTVPDRLIGVFDVNAGLASTAGAIP